MYVSKAALVKLALALVAVLAVLWYVRDEEAKDAGQASNDIPVVIRTNGGLLEVATIKHRRTFDITKVFTVLGWPVPVCKETATYTVDAAITYRIKLRKRWVGEVSDGVLSIVAPSPEPAIPVAFDTSRLRATLDKCRFAPSLNAKDDLLRSISAELAKDARGQKYMRFAHGPEAKATVAEFAQDWMLKQTKYDLPKNTKIKVSFADE